MSSTREPINILVVTPCFTGAVSDVYTHSMLALQSTCSANEMVLAVMTVGHEAAHIGARNIGLASFLKHPGFTHLLLCDAGTGFSPEIITRWLDFSRDLVCGAVPAPEIDWFKLATSANLDPRTVQSVALKYNVSFEDPAAIEAERSFAKVKSAPMNLCLIRRRGLEEMISTHADRKFRLPPGLPVSDSEFCYALFERSIDPETQIRQGEDQTFLNRWRASGHAVWLDLDAKLVNAHQYMFRGDVTTQFAPAIEAPKG